MRGQYVIGIDFGSDSVRAILVDTKSAQTLQTAVAEYPRWKEKKYMIRSANIVNIRWIIWNVWNRFWSRY